MIRCEILAFKFAFFCRSPSIGPNKPQAVVNPSQVMRVLCPFTIDWLIICLFTLSSSLLFFNLLSVSVWGHTCSCCLLVQATWACCSKQVSENILYTKIRGVLGRQPTTGCSIWSINWGCPCVQHQHVGWLKIDRGYPPLICINRLVEKYETVKEE